MKGCELNEIAKSCLKPYKEHSHTFYFIQFWPTHFFVYGLIPYFTAKLQDVQYDAASFRPERGSGQQ